MPGTDNLVRVSGFATPGDRYPGFDQAARAAQGEHLTFVYAELRTDLEIQGIGLSAMDLLIVARALAESCTLISADRALTQVPGLRVLEWSAPVTQ